jgi:ankyrin repeat protein
MLTRCLSAIPIQQVAHENDFRPSNSSFNLGDRNGSLGKMFARLDSHRSMTVLCDQGIPDNSIETLLEGIRSQWSADRVTEYIRGSRANLLSTDVESWTPLHWAVEMGRVDLVPVLLNAQPMLLHMKTKEGLSAINIAAWTGNVRMVELLLRQGAEIDDKTKWGESPLHHAVTFGFVDVVELLLKAGANPHSTDRLERTPAQIASQKGTEKMKKLFSPYMRVVVP